MADHRLQRNQQPASPDRDEAREPLRNLDAREALLVRLRVANGDAEAERETRDVRERLPRPDAEWGQHRVDLALEARRELGELRVVTLVEVGDDDAVLREGGAELPVPELGLTSSQLEDACAELGEGLLGRQPVRRADEQARLDLVEQARDAHHEELVEVRRADRTETNALEQRLVGIGGEIEHAAVELQPRELPVEEPLGLRARKVLDRHSRIISGSWLQVG